MPLTVLYQLKTKTMRKTIIVILIAFLMIRCAESQPNINQCLEGHEYGFWGGLWHGMIAPISFIISIFDGSIEMYAPNNNGGWYAFGFVLGAGILGAGGSSASKRK